MKCKVYLIWYKYYRVLHRYTTVVPHVVIEREDENIMLYVRTKEKYARIYFQKVNLLKPNKIKVKAKSIVHRLIYKNKNVDKVDNI